MNASPRLVAIVDDDESIRESLPDLLREFGFRAEAFPSAEQFLASNLVCETECLLLDIHMPGMTGPDLEQELARRGQPIPIIFITALRDDSVKPIDVKKGSIECLLKPFSDVALQNALNSALDSD